MDTKTIVHIGTEVIVIGGLTFYFTKQINDLKTQNAALLQRVNQLTEVLQQHDQILHTLVERNSQRINPRRPQPRQRQPAQSKIGFTPEELDQELGDELKKLDEENIEDIEDIEDVENCEGGVCYIKEEDSTKKRVRFQDGETTTTPI